MPQHEYKCENGHLITRFVSIKDVNEPLEVITCAVDQCGLTAERLAPVTGTPILKPGGVGGFYRPSRS
jgi:hypothetical protein